MKDTPVTLRTGRTVLSDKVEEVVSELRYLIEENLLVYDDLVMLCRNPSYKPFLSAELYLKDHFLMLQDGSIDDSIKDIVLASTEGSGLVSDLVSPFTGEVIYQYSCF